MNIDTKQLGIYLALLPGLVTMTVARLMSHLPGLDASVVIMAIFAASLFAVGPVIAFAHFLFFLYERFYKLYQEFYAKKKKIYQKVINTDDIFHKPMVITSIFVLSVFNGIILAIAYENAWANRAVMWIASDYALFSKKSEHSSLQIVFANLRLAEGIPDYRCDALRSCGIDEPELPKDKNNPSNRNDPPKKTRLLDVHGADGMRVQGYLEIWSGEPKVNEIFLAPACTREAGSKDFEAVPGPGVFVRLGDALRIDILDELPRLCPVRLRRTDLDRTLKCQALVDTADICQQRQRR